MSADACRLAGFGPPAHFEGQELITSGSNVVEMTIRPTYILDPLVEILPSRNQLKVLVQQIKEERSRGDRSIILTVSKRDSEDLSLYLQDNGIKAEYLHCGLSTINRSEVLKSLQVGDIDAIVGYD